MKIAPIFLFVLSGMFLALLITARPHQTAAAQVCYDANKQVIPCPEQDTGPDKKKKNTPRPPIPTSTSTATTTPTPTPTPTPSPSPTPALAVVATSANSGGFACPPYRSGLPIGAVILAAGALTLMFAGRGGLLRQAPPAATEVSRSAIPMGGDSGGGNSGVGRFFLRWVSRLSPRDPASGLPSMNQQTGAAAGAAQLIGTALAGAGSGILGAALLGGLFDFSCISTNILLSVGALLGLMGAPVLGMLTKNTNSLLRLGRTEHGRPDSDYSTFERIGTVDSAGNTSGGSGLYKDKPLE